MNGCMGLVYETHTDGKGSIKRRAFKICPQVSLIQSLRRMFRRKGFSKMIRDSRQKPIHQNDDENFLMTDMYDGELWHDLKTGIQREVGDLGTVRDSPAPGVEELGLTSHRFGLHLTVNLDWCVSSFDAISFCQYF
jgi:hypothetical protein